MPVATIAGETGSAGPAVGRRWAERLGADLVDRSLIALLAAHGWTAPPIRRRMCEPLAQGHRPVDRSSDRGRPRTRSAVAREEADGAST